ncbi:MAG: hypothetical protein R6U44_06810 [Archaeoglobaceae archaeon]
MRKKNILDKSLDKINDMEYLATVKVGRIKPIAIKIRPTGIPTIVMQSIIPPVMQINVPMLQYCRQ